MQSFKPPVTEKHAVYIIYNPEGIVEHVGRSVRGRKGLVQRLTNHLYGNSSFVIKHLSGKGKKLRQGYQFQYLEIEDDRKRALVECLAAGELCPAHVGLGQTREDKKIARDAKEIYRT